jgi:hypothetical protein
MQCIIMPDGTVGRARIVRSLDGDVDDQALAKVRRWVFSLATLDGKPVPYLATLTLAFRIF